MFATKKYQSNFVWLPSNKNHGSHLCRVVTCLEQINPCMSLCAPSTSFSLQHLFVA